MTIVTNNVRLGTAKGMGKGITGSDIGPSLTYVNATPDEILTGRTGSDLAIDVNGGELYMVQAAGGSEWIRLISGT